MAVEVPRVDAVGLLQAYRSALQASDPLRKGQLLSIVEPSPCVRGVLDDTEACYASATTLCQQYAA